MPLGGRFPSSPLDISTSAAKITGPCPEGSLDAPQPILNFLLVQKHGKVTHIRTSVPTLQGNADMQMTNAPEAAERPGLSLCSMLSLEHSQQFYCGVCTAQAGLLILCDEEGKASLGKATASGGNTFCSWSSVTSAWTWQRPLLQLCLLGSFLAHAEGRDAWAPSQSI